MLLFRFYEDIFFANPHTKIERGAEYMLENRAIEIISSARFIEVTFNGQPVWIESVDKESDLAVVMPCGSDEKIKVPIAELVEES